MSALEDRIRTGLNADRAVPDLWDAVQHGARRSRARRATGVVAAAVLAVAVVAVGVTVSLGGTQKPAPVETPTPSPTPSAVPPFPGAREPVMSTTSSGDRVFVLTESHTLWTYADGEWTAQEDLPIPKRQLAAIDFSPNGGNGVIQPQQWTGDASADFAVTADGGRTWSRGTPPVPGGGGATATDTGFFYLGSTTPPRTGVSSDPAATGIYRSADGRTNWVRTGPAPSSSILPSHLFARGNDLVAYVPGGDFAVSADEGRNWGFLPRPCQAVGRDFEAAAYTFDTGLATGEEIVVNCHPGDATTIQTKHERQNQVVHTVDLARWEPIGPPVASTLCCFPISDDAAVGADLLLTPDGTRQIDLPLETRFWGAHAARADGTTYLAFFGQLWVSRDDGLTWTELTH